MTSSLKMLLKFLQRYCTSDFWLLVGFWYEASQPSFLQEKVLWFCSEKFYYCKTWLCKSQGEFDPPLTCSFMTKHRWQKCWSCKEQLFRRWGPRTLYVRLKKQVLTHRVEITKSNVSLSLHWKWSFDTAALLPVTRLCLSHLLPCPCSCQNYKPESFLKIRSNKSFPISS